MKQQRTDARSLTADQQKRIEEVCFRSLALIGHNCEYLEQHFDRTGADESTRQAVADINAAAVKLDRTLSEAMTLLEFLRGDEKPQLYPVDLCDLLRPARRRCAGGAGKPPQLSGRGTVGAAALSGVLPQDGLEPAAGACA